MPARKVRRPAGSAPTTPGRHLVERDPRELGTLCACGCKRRRPPIAVADLDPFATAACCQRWHGVESRFPKGKGVFSSAAL